MSDWLEIFSVEETLSTHHFTSFYNFLVLLIIEDDFFSFYFGYLADWSHATLLTFYQIFSTILEISHLLFLFKYFLNK